MNAERGPEENVVRMLQYIGEDVQREGLLETPERVVRSWYKLYGGYRQDPKDILKTFEDDSSDEMVVLKDIEFYSTCEHHILPFFGKAHIAYIPDGKVVGISKLARLLECFARRLQIQERICRQVTSILMKELRPLGAACLLEAQHFCMTSRGVEKQNSIMVTSSLEGVFKSEKGVKEEFLTIVRG
ncbi:MAG: GTP cyclohydrolase I FolE [Thermoplasmata archaeon]|nr:MAG: GTP cyclohydrolase I FolE [Thermoplasmata archaeon]